MCDRQPSRGLSVVKRFREDVRASTAMIFAVAALPLMVVGGVALSYGMAITTKTKMQTALDAAVLAGTALPVSASSDNRIKAAREAYDANFPTAKGSPSKHAGYWVMEGSDPRFTVNGFDVTGESDAKVWDPFGKLYGNEWTEIGVQAVATKMVSHPICILGLDPQEAETIDFNGKAVLSAPTCAVQANSASGAGMNQVGQPQATALQFGVTGNYRGTNYTPQPITGTVPVEDPYLSLPFPPIGPCKATNLAIKDTVTLDPGTYCGGIQVQSGAQVTLNPGIYIMKDGPLWLTGGGGKGGVSGKEVMIAFTGYDATLYMNGSSTMKLTSPVSGPYMNIQFFARDAFRKSWLTAGIVGNNTLEYDGVMYMPEHHIWFAGGSNVSATSPTYSIIGKKVWFQDNSIVNVTRANPRGLAIGDDQLGRFKYSARLVR